MMTIAATATAPPSARLRRKPALPPAWPHDVPTRVRITGLLLEDAHAVTEPATGRAAYSVVVSGRQGPDIIATRWVGDGPEAALAARTIAEALRCGDLVDVEGDGLHLRQHRGVLAVHIGTATRIDLHAEPGREAA